MKTIIGYVLLGLIILGGGYYYFTHTDSNSPGTGILKNGDPIPDPEAFFPTYRNSQYQFYVTLRESWTGYTVIESTWQGFSLDSKGQNQNSETGPLISLRHPAWTESSPRQDIPIMIFTLKQWEDLKADKFHIGAAPVNPTELTRNKTFIFALPARYNFAYQTGFEEVDQIIKGGAIRAY